jgi:hypothetical protein
VNRDMERQRTQCNKNSKSRNVKSQSNSDCQIKITSGPLIIGHVASDQNFADLGSTEHSVEITK